MRYLISGWFVMAAAWSQQLDLSSLDRLADRAKESSYVALDADKLKMASGFLSDKDTNGVKELVSKLKGVYIRTFEFAKAGTFTRADLDPVRKQLKAPGWTKAIEIKEETESAEIYFYKMGSEAGIAIVTSEPTEISVVNIVGPIDLNSLAKMGGTFGIPNIHSGFLTDKPAPAVKGRE